MGIKYPVNEKFFDTWSRHMAYVLGYIYADGSLEFSPKVRGKYLRISSTDKGTLEKIRSWSKSRHRIIELPLRDVGKPQFLLRIGNSKLYDSLTKLGLYPNKSLTIELPVIPEKYFFHFLRGYFDGDGCVYLERGYGKNGSIIIKRIRTIFTSGSHAFLDRLSLEIEKRSTTKRQPVHKNLSSFQLKYGTKESIYLFEKLYQDAFPDIFLPRKFAVYAEYLELREKWKSSKVTSILSELGHVAK